MAIVNGVVQNEVTDTDIAQALEYGSYDLKACYDNGKIAINSWNKPMRATFNFGDNPDFTISDNQRRSADWGWGGIIQQGLLNAIKHKTSGGQWNIAIQQGSNAGYSYRYLDLLGYNKNSDIPCKLSLANATNGEVLNSQPIRMIMADFYTEIQPYIHLWGCMPSGLDRKKIGLGFYLDYYNDANADKYAYMLCAASGTQFTFDTIGENDEVKDFAISADFVTSRLPYSTGTYKIIPFIIPDTSGLSIQSNQALRLGDYNGNVFTFHQEPLVVYIKAQATPIDQVNYGGLVSKNVSFSGNRISVLSMVINITNDGGSSQSVSISVQPDSAYIVGAMSGSFATKTITIGAYSSVNVEMVTSAPSWETYNKNTMVDITITVGSTSKVVDNVQLYSPKEE